MPLQPHNGQGVSVVSCWATFTPSAHVRRQSMPVWSPTLNNNLYLFTFGPRGEDCRVLAVPFHEADGAITLVARLQLKWSPRPRSGFVAGVFHHPNHVGLHRNPCREADIFMHRSGSQFVTTVDSNHWPWTDMLL